MFVYVCVYVGYKLNLYIPD